MLAWKPNQHRQHFYHNALTKISEQFLTNLLKRGLKTYNCVTFTCSPDPWPPWFIRGSFLSPELNHEPSGLTQMQLPGFGFGLFLFFAFLNYSEKIVKGKGWVDKRGWEDRTEAFATQPWEQSNRGRAKSGLGRRFICICCWEGGDIGVSMCKG